MRGHTDIRQECDCVMNKPLKLNFTNAFKLYLHGMHNKYLLQHANNTSSEMHPFIMDLRDSIMKPLMPKFAVYALSFLQTEAFEGSIRASFLKDGLLQDARDPNTYAKALTADYIISMISSPASNILSEEEREEDVGHVNIQDGEDSVDILTLEALSIGGESAHDDNHIDAPANIIGYRSCFGLLDTNLYIPFYRSSIYMIVDLIQMAILSILNIYHYG